MTLVLQAQARELEAPVCVLQGDTDQECLRAVQAWFAKLGKSAEKEIHSIPGGGIALLEEPVCLENCLEILRSFVSYHLCDADDSPSTSALAFLGNV